MGRGGAVKIVSKIMTDLINYSVNYEADCRTAPATPGLLKISKLYRFDLCPLKKSSFYPH